MEWKQRWIVEWGIGIGIGRGRGAHTPSLWHGEPVLDVRRQRDGRRTRARTRTRTRSRARLVRRDGHRASKRRRRARRTGTCWHKGAAIGAAAAATGGGRGVNAHDAQVKERLARAEATRPTLHQHCTRTTDIQRTCNVLMLMRDSSPKEQEISASRRVPKFHLSYYRVWYSYVVKRLTYKHEIENK